MTKDREALIRRVIEDLVMEQSCGEWDTDTIKGDANLIFEGLFLFFDSGDIK
jgi:translation initiation factor 2 beta subunit (eIF-2beta)/eIF-5